jgi:hypothetical protein
MTVTIVRAEMTCLAAPSQWDAWDSEGRYWYLRFRHGHGKARQYTEGPDWWAVAWTPEPAETREFEHGDPFDGFIALDEFARLAGLELDLPAEYWEQHADDGQVIAQAAEGMLAWLEGVKKKRESRDSPRPDGQARGEEGRR